LRPFAIGAGTAIAAAQSSTDWGWPQPYEKVSDKSVAWLKEKGWWPLGVGWQGPFLGSEHDQRGDGQGGAARQSAASKRNIRSLPPVRMSMKRFASARVQVGNGGNFPFTSLLDRGVPVRAIAVIAPNLKHSTVVPVDSPLEKARRSQGQQSVRYGRNRHRLVG